MAISLDPKHANAYFKRGNARNDLGEYLDAIADYTEVININPNIAKAYLLRGTIKNNALGDKHGSLIDLQKAAQLFQKQGDLVLYRKTRENIVILEGLS